MSRTRKIFIIPAIVCFSFSIAVANQLGGTTPATDSSASNVSPAAAVCMLEHHFHLHKVVQPFGLRALAPPLRINNPCGAAP
jgi:hypothetical protein